jgi:hypothetical protein
MEFFQDMQWSSSKTFPWRRSTEISSGDFRKKKPNGANRSLASSIELASLMTTPRQKGSPLKTWCKP